MAYIELVDRSEKAALLQSNLRQRKKPAPAVFFYTAASPLTRWPAVLFFLTSGAFGGYLTMGRASYSRRQAKKVSL